MHECLIAESNGHLKHWNLRRTSKVGWKYNYQHWTCVMHWHSLRWSVVSQESKIYISAEAKLVSQWQLCITPISLCNSCHCSLQRMYVFHLDPMLWRLGSLKGCMLLPWLWHVTNKTNELHNPTQLLVMWPVVTSKTRKLPSKMIVDTLEPLQWHIIRGERGLVCILFPQS